MRFVQTAHAPRPAGHYSQALVHGGVVYVAGQLPIDPNWPDAPHGSVEEQVVRVLRNVEAILHAAGSDLESLLAVTIYVTDIALWPRVNATYAEVLGGHRPARTVVPVPALHHDYLVEVSATAALRAQ
jgi:2-iminobutanoate/2-iminopropanoate deaminase